MKESERMEDDMLKEKQNEVETEEEMTYRSSDMLISSVRNLGEKIKQKQKKLAEQLTMYDMTDEEAYALSREAPARFKSDDEKIRFLFVDRDGRIRRSSSKNYIPYITRSETRKILLCAINLIEYEEGHIHFITTDRQNYKMIGDWSYVYPYLNRNFCHVSKKRMVNMENVVHTKNCNIIFANGQTYEVCTSNFHEFRHTYTDYLTE